MSNTMTAEMMMEYLFRLPEQFEHCLTLDIHFVDRYCRDYRNIVVSGLGGSAIGGDILRTMALSRARLPVQVNRDYTIPAFVDKNTLFLAVSYSGNTEETLSAYRQALERGASIICVCGGGKLSDLARADGCGLVTVPPGLVPRAATGYLFAPLALIMERLGLLPGVQDEMKETIQILKEMRGELAPEAPEWNNRARDIARAMKDSIPVIWGSAGVSEVAALRWKAQINENAKSPAYYHVFPELNHNEIVGFAMPPDLLRRVCVLILRDQYDHERVKRRMDISTEIIEHRVKDVLTLKSRGESFMARFYSLAYVGDYASTYLALEYGINPTPVEIIDFLKNELAKC